MRVDADLVALRAARRGLNQRALAQRANISASAVSRAVRGQGISKGAVRSIARVLGLTTAQLRRERAPTGKPVLDAGAVRAAAQDAPVWLIAQRATLGERVVYYALRGKPVNAQTAWLICDALGLDIEQGIRLQPREPFGRTQDVRAHATEGQSLIHQGNCLQDANTHGRSDGHPPSC